jgi:hypothetical protein
MQIHAQAVWQAYVAVLGGVSLIALGVVAALNYRIDPYLTHQWNTRQVQRLLPGQEKLSPWGKTYALAVFRPQVLYLGNSRTELGLPVESGWFGGRRVFNAALSGATLGDAAAMAQHALAVAPLQVVVWGIDAPSFTTEAGNTDFDRKLIASDGGYFLQRAMLDLKRAISVDMTLDSMRLLTGAASTVCQSSLALYGQRDGLCVLKRLESMGGTRAAMVPRVRDFVRGMGPSTEAMRELERSGAALCKAGVQLRLYINPAHAMTSEALIRAGKWPTMQAWQTQLTSWAQSQRQFGCDVRLYDFSGYNGVTTETIPQASGRPDMQYYWEASHYRTNVGRMILASMLGALQFGAELRSTTLEAHQQEQWAAHERYQREHPVESALIQAMR